MAEVKASKSPGNGPQPVDEGDEVVEALLVVVVVTGVLVDEVVGEVAGPVYEKLWLHQSDGTPPVNLGTFVAVAR